MKAKFVTINNLDGTMAYVSLMPVTDDEFERLKLSGRAIEVDTNTLPLSHDDPESALRYQHLQQYEQMLEAAEKRIAELEKQLTVTEQSGSNISLEWNALVEKQEQRITQLEAVCREVIDNFMISYVNRVKSGIRVEANWGGYYAKYRDEDKHEYEMLARLLDSLPPAE